MPSQTEPSEPPLRFTSYGKLLLFGEHAAVYGYPALGVSLDCSLKLSVDQADSPGDEGRFPDLEPRDRAAADNLIVQAAELLPDLTFPDAIYRLEGNVPRSSGFGSSATVCVNLSRYIIHLAESQNVTLDDLLPQFQYSSNWPDEEKKQYLVWFIANHLEKAFHGSPSGIDTGLATLGGIQAFFPRSRRLPDSMKLESDGMWLIYGAVPRQGNTKTLVGELQEGMLNEQPKVVHAMEQLGELAHSAIGCFRDAEINSAKRAEALGDLARQAHSRLSSLNLHTEDMDHVLDKARKLGSPGGKLSGAGGGGAFYFYANDESSARELQERLTVWCGKKHIDLSHPLTLLKI